MRPPPEYALRAVRTGTDALGYDYWGFDEANFLRELLQSVVPFPMGFALQSGGKILEPGNTWDWQGLPNGWVQVGPNQTPWPPASYKPGG